MSKASVSLGFRLLSVSRLLKGLRGVAVVLVKRKTYYELARRKDVKESESENIRSMNMIMKTHLFFSVKRSVFASGLFSPSDVASNYLQCHRQIDV